MDMSLAPEQEMLIDTARKIGERYGLEYWRELDGRKAYPKDLWEAVCEAGLCGAALPEEYGGTGLGMVELALIIEALAASGAGATVGQLFMLNPIFGGVSISRFGSQDMKATLLPKLMSGQLTFCMALTEPDAGSNSLNLRSFARAHNNGWCLNGRKIWITAVPQSEKMLVVARTTKIEEVKRKTDGISLFLIDTDREGVTHQAIEKVGTNTLPSSNVFFDDVQIERNELLGTLDAGWPQLLDVLNTERIVTTAGLVGAAKLALRLGCEYAVNRRVFGSQPIGAYQGIQFPLAQAYAEGECARLMNLKAASLFDTGQPYGSEANVAKLIAAQAAAKATEHAMQTMGGMGYAKEYHVERLWRDCRLFKFAPVAEEMILNFIAMQNLGLPRSY